MRHSKRLCRVFIMFNFICSSILVKKREIGILRAIGARVIDVFKIFMTESLIIALFCIVLSCLGSIGCCILLNWILTIDTALLLVNLFVFCPVSIICILGIALIISFISTFIPILLYSERYLVESIRTL